MYQKIMEAWPEDDGIQVTVDRDGGGGFTLNLTEEDIRRAGKEIRYPRPLKTDAQRAVFCRLITGKTINVSCLGDNTDLKSAIKEVKRKMSKKTVKVEMLFYGYDRSKTKPKDLIDKFTGAKKSIQDIKGMGKAFKGFNQVKTEKPGEEKEDELTLILSFDKNMHEKGNLEPLLTEVISVLLNIKEVGDIEFGKFEVKE